MNYQTSLLYGSTVAIWGSTWLVITFQLGTVDPIISVIYRMALASVLLFLLCRFLGVTLRASRVDHLFFMIQGVLSFGVNFWFIYMSEMFLTSGIIAVIFSLIVFFNLINGRIFLKRPIEKNTALGGLVGLCGLYLLFSPELSNASTGQDALKGFGLAFTAVFSASLGNMSATRSGMLGHSVWRINAWATLYGAAALTIIALLTGTAFHVVMAGHADQSLAMLDEPSSAEQSLLGAFSYEENEAVLHRDENLMPKRHQVWSSWNYLADTSQSTNKVSVSYWMNLLQHLPCQESVLLTLNPLTEPRRDRVYRRFSYQHPVFNEAALQAQHKLWSLQGQQRTWYCGSYFGYGFHEDGIQSGLAVAEQLGNTIRPWIVPNASGRIHLSSKPVIDNAA